jgi:hypothetical protein
MERCCERWRHVITILKSKISLIPATALMKQKTAKPVSATIRLFPLMGLQLDHLRLHDDIVLTARSLDGLPCFRLLFVSKSKR